MTRCKAFYQKMKKLRDDPEAAAEFCQKESKSIQEIYRYIDFMDEHFPNWLDDDLKEEISSIKPQSIKLISGLTKTNPDIVNCVLEEVCQLESPTTSEVKKIIREKTKPAPVPLPSGQFDVIYGDPPWRYDFSLVDNDRIEKHYPTMELEDIKTLDVPSADDAVLFLWATAPKLKEALEVMKAWGFEYKTHAIWDKEIFGLGYWFRGQHELILIGTKGDFSPPEPKNRIPSVIRQKKGKHSEKPKLFYEIIEQMCPDSKYLELFARGRRDGWTMWGSES